MDFSLRWDLESVFSESSLQSVMDAIKASLTFLETHPEEPILPALLKLQQVQKNLGQMQTYAHCLLAENTLSDKGPLLENMVQSFHAQSQKIHTRLCFAIKHLSESEFQELLSACSDIGLDFTVKEMRFLASLKLSEIQESLMTDLAVDGYHGFSQLYSTLHGHLTFEINGLSLSYGQLENLMHDPSDAVRKQAFACYSKVFDQYKQHFAQILNHIAGFRLHMYRQRKWDSCLFEPLISNRMQEKTLKAMWACVHKHQSLFAKYLEKKAQLLSKEKLSWVDIETPLEPSKKLTSYNKGCALILDQLEKYSPMMRRFSERALKEGWVEAENRPGKAAGGFCAALPIKQQSRIFMTYLGTDSNISTLAHELGHAYHNHHIFHHPYLAQDIKMNVAETASTMFELIVSQGLLHEAKSKKEKLALLDEKITRSIAFFMNIQARYTFETRFYEERRHGSVSAERLCHLMEISQKEAYDHALGSYNPLLWASKMHFYFTDVPFYNFPYTFGYLFSLGLFAILSEHPQDFEKKYNALLQDTPVMSTEDLAKKHLGVSLDEPYFWEMALEQSIKDIRIFFELI